MIERLLSLMVGLIVVLVLATLIGGLVWMCVYTWSALLS